MAIPGASYYYWVKSVGGGGTSDFSMGDAGHRALVMDLQITESGCDLSWGALEGVTYILERSTNLSMGGWTPIHIAIPVSDQTYYFEDRDQLERAFYRISD